MSKQIQVSDQLHEELRAESKKAYRSIPAQIEFYKDFYEGDSAFRKQVRETAFGGARGSGKIAPWREKIEKPLKGMHIQEIEGMRENDDLFNTPPKKIASDPSGEEEFKEQPCCQQKSPCKHWFFDGENWVNTFSGRRRETE